MRMDIDGLGSLAVDDDLASPPLRARRQACHQLAADKSQPSQGAGRIAKHLPAGSHWASSVLFVGSHYRPLPLASKITCACTDRPLVKRARRFARTREL